MPVRQVFRGLPSWRVRVAPPAATADLAENLMRQTLAVLDGVRQVHDDGGAVILVNPSSNMAVVANWRNDHYSVVSVRPYQGDPQNLWGVPNRVGRLTFPTRDAAATSPSTTDAEALKLRQGRTGLDVKSEKFDLTNGAAQQQAAPTVTVKKRRTIDIKRSANGAVQGFFDPQTGQSFLIADNLCAEAAPGTLMHEVGIHMAADGSMKALFNRAAMMLKLQRGNPFMKAVQARMDAAGETSGEEAAMPSPTSMPTHPTMALPRKFGSLFQPGTVESWLGCKSSPAWMRWRSWPCPLKPLLCRSSAALAKCSTLPPGTSIGWKLSR